MASISNINTNSVFIIEILLKKKADIKDILFCRYRSFKGISSYININGCVAEATIAIVVNIVKALDISIMIYTAFTHL